MERDFIKVASRRGARWRFGTGGLPCNIVPAAAGGNSGRLKPLQQRRETCLRRLRGEIGAL
ncbi:MAG TPA: hypothetical protein VK420_16795, partial [Longimicrobium sp.]|nr:hypothetical protein [Longimicrobium sp.]